MSRFESRFERLELKYLIDEATAERVRRDIEPYCAPDPHNEPGPDRRPRGYRVTSLYLDSPGLALHHAKERGDPERIKLRVRSYRGSPIAVLERKRRVADVIDKTRAVVRREEARAAALGRYEHMADEGPEEARFLDLFAGDVARVGAEPTLLVSYEREAYASCVDHYARVTFDRHIQATRADGWGLDETDGPHTVHFDDYWSRAGADRRVVLELKCQSCVPWWITELVRRHALKRQSFSKYSVGIYLTGLEAGEDLLARRSARWVS